MFPAANELSKAGAMTHIESNFVKVGPVAIDLELINTPYDLLHHLWLIGGIVSGDQIGEVIELVAAYKAWDIGI